MSFPLPSSVSATPSLHSEEEKCYQQRCETKHIASVKVDYSSVVGNNFINYETGLRWVQTQNTNNSWFKKTIDGVVLPDAAFTDKTELTEQVAAFYLTTSKQFGKFSIKGGLRGEYSQWSLEKDNTTLRDSSVFEWFPSITLFYKPVDGVSIGINYSKKIQRPNFQATARSMSYVNQYLYRESNPNLRPILMESIGFETMIGKNILFELDYTKYNNYINLAWEQQGNIVIVKEKNFDKEELSGSLGVTYRNKWISTNNNMGLSKPWFVYKYKDEIIKTDIGYTLSSSNSFYLPKYFDIKITIRYSNYGVTSHIVEEPYFYISAGISKFFYDRSLRFSLYAKYWSNDEFTVKYGNVNLHDKLVCETPIFSFSILYSFNKVKTKTNSKISSQSDELRRKN